MTEKERSLVEKVGQAASENEKKFPGCTQAVLGAFRQVLGDKVVTEAVFKAGCGMCGGVANTGNACGAVSGGVMVIGLFSGRDEANWGDGDRMFHTFRMGQKLTQHFKEKYWSVDCRDIQEKLMGRAFNTNYKEELEAFEAAGGHDKHCPQVVRTAAEKVMEVLLEEGLVEA